MSEQVADVQKLVNSVVTIASLPSIYFRVSEAVNCPRSSATDIANVVAEDPGLTARLLKLVNSSFFSFSSRIDTVSRSVSIVGTQQLCDLCLATSVMKAFKDVPEELVTMESFWLHSLACGICARLIATEFGVNNSERFFVAGLLHDIGSLILYLKIPDLSLHCLEVAKTQKLKLHEVERKLIGYDHAEVGYELVKLWNLPEALHEAVRFHHMPQNAVDFPLETAIVHISDIMVSALRLGTNGDSFVPPLSPKAWETIDLSPNALSRIIDNIDGQLDDVVRVMFKE